MRTSTSTLLAPAPVASALAEIDTAGTTVVAALIQQVRAGHAHAARSLGNLGAAGAAAIPTLISELESRDGQRRWEAALALAKIGRPAVPRLLEALQAQNWRVRGLAAHALGGVGEATKAATQALTERLKDPHPYVRNRAESALNLE